MTDALAMSEIKQLLLVALDSGSTDGERINALRFIQRKMNPHDLVRQLVSKEEMQQVFDKGVEKGRNEEVENARRNAVTIEAPFADTDVGPGIGPLQLATIIALQGATRLASTLGAQVHSEVARKLLYSRRSRKEAAKHQIFLQRFGERI
jgi:hypothetical protein